MEDITFLNIIRKVKFLFSTHFSSNIVDLAENIRLEGPEKQAMSVLEQIRVTATAAVHLGGMFSNQACYRRLIACFSGSVVPQY